MGAEEQLQQEYRMQAEGYDVEKIIERVAELMEIPSEEIVTPGKGRKRTKARSMLCYWATDRLGISQTQLAHTLNLTQSAVSQAARRGKELVKSQRYSFYNEQFL